MVDVFVVVDVKVVVDSVFQSVVVRVFVLVAKYVTVGVSAIPFAVELSSVLWEGEVGGRGITVAVEMTTTIDGEDDDRMGTY